MAKRFVDTDIWDKQWFMELPPRLKCFVKFVRDKCDQAGVWQPNMVLANTYIGEPCTINDLLSIDGGNQFEKMPCGKIFCVGFIFFQYGELTETCMPHRKIIALLKKHEIFERVSKGYRKGIYTLQDKEEDKEADKDKEKEEDKDKKQKAEKPKAHLFVDSEYFDLAKFIEQFKGGKYEQFNLEFYHESLIDWSAQGNKKLDWIATARGFMKSSAQEGKAVLQGQNLLQNGKQQQNSSTIQSGLDKIDAMYRDVEP